MNKEKLERVLGVCKSMRGLPPELGRIAGLSEMLVKTLEALLEDEGKQEPWAYKGMPVLVWNDNPERKKYKAFLVEVLEEGVGALEASCTATVDLAGANPLTWANWEPDWEHSDMWHPCSPDRYNTPQNLPDKQGCVYCKNGTIECGNLQAMATFQGLSEIVAFRLAPEAPKFFSEDGRKEK